MEFKSKDDVMHGRLYTKVQVAELLNVSTRTIERIQASGQLGFHRVGGSCRYSLAQVQEYLMTSARKPAGQLLPIMG